MGIHQISMLNTTEKQILCLTESDKSNEKAGRLGTPFDFCRISWGYLFDDCLEMNLCQCHILFPREPLLLSRYSQVCLSKLTSQKIRQFSGRRFVIEDKPKNFIDDELYAFCHMTCEFSHF
jgi:hypothetical protein